MKRLAFLLLLALLARAVWLFVQVRYHVRFEMR